LELIEPPDLEKDFFAQGGDSLGLLNLQSSVASTFGSSFKIASFLEDASLPGLARLLSIEVPDVIARLEGLKFRLLKAASEQSKGIALVLPGWSGRADTKTLLDTNVFRDYDLWSADKGLAKGNILQNDNWWRTAREIEAQIRKGVGPAPRLLVGFSIAGTIAWLVAASLTGSEWAPEAVIMIDAPGIAVLPIRAKREATQWLNPLAERCPSPILHILREQSTSNGYCVSRSGRWKSCHGISAEILVPTVEHLDMYRPTVLALAELGILQFLADPKAGERLHIPLGSVPSDGGVLFSELAGAGQYTTEDWIRISTQLPRSGGWLVLISLLNCLLKEGLVDEANGLVQRLIQLYPSSGLLRYAHRRMRRPSLGIDSHGIDNVFISSCLAIDRSLSRSHSTQKRTITWWIIHRLDQVCSIITVARFKVISILNRLTA
jgi:hypothetical protein